MSFLSTFVCRSRITQYPKPPLGGCIIGPRVVLRIGETTDWKSWRLARESSRDFLVPWEPSWPSHALTSEHFSAQLRRHWKEWREGKGYAFQICLKNKQTIFDGELSLPLYKQNIPREILAEVRSLPVIGGIALNDVARGIGQKGTLGYWIDESYSRQGLMKEAASLVCSFAFDVLRLHRIEASCMTENEPSKRLLASLDFKHEGFAEEYLKINGHWRDHLLWGKVNEG